MTNCSCSHCSATNQRDIMTTHYYYDGQSVLAEYNDSDELQRYFVHGATYIDEHVLMHERGDDYYSK